MIRDFSNAQREEGGYIVVAIAPPGTRRVIEDNVRMSRCERITRIESREIFESNINGDEYYAKRIQYPLKVHIATTCHKVAGDTLDKIVTCLSTRYILTYIYIHIPNTHHFRHRRNGSGFSYYLYIYLRNSIPRWSTF